MWLLPSNIATKAFNQSMLLCMIPRYHALSAVKVVQFSKSVYLINIHQLSLLLLIHGNSISCKKAVFQLCPEKYN